MIKRQYVVSLDILLPEVEGIDHSEVLERELTNYLKENFGEGSDPRVRSLKTNYIMETEE